MDMDGRTEGGVGRGSADVRRRHGSVGGGGPRAADLCEERQEAQCSDDRHRSGAERRQLSQGAARKTARTPRVDGARDARRKLSCPRSEEQTSELQSLMRNSYAVFCLKKKKKTTNNIDHNSN